MNPQDDIQDVPQDEVKDEVPTDESPVDNPEPTPGETVQPQGQPPQAEAPQTEEVETKGYEQLTPNQQQQLQDLSDEELNTLVSQLKPGEDGTVDLKEVVKVLNQHQTQRSREIARSETLAVLGEVEATRQAWEDVYKDYPQVRTNPELHRLVENQRLGNLADGKATTPKQAASELFKHLNTARQEGTTEAQERVRVAQAAHLETSSVQDAPGTQDTAQLYNQVGHRDNARGREARQELIKKWLESGDIKTA